MTAVIDLLEEKQCAVKEAFRFIYFKHEENPSRCKQPCTHHFTAKVCDKHCILVKCQVDSSATRLSACYYKYVTSRHHET
jgi:hypothetical protein